MKYVLCDCGCTTFFVPVTLHEPMHSLQGPEVSGNAVVGEVAPQHPIEVEDLLAHRQVSHTPHSIAQAGQTALQPRFLGAHPHLKVALSVARAIQGETHEIDRLWAFPPPLGCVLVGITTELDELGLARLQGQAKLSQPFAQGRLEAQGIFPVLETHNKVIDVPHQVGLAP